MCQKCVFGETSSLRCCRIYYYFLLFPSKQHTQHTTSLTQLDRDEASILLLFMLLFYFTSSIVWPLYVCVCAMKEMTDRMRIFFVFLLIHIVRCMVVIERQTHIRAHTHDTYEWQTTPFSPRNFRWHLTQSHTAPLTHVIYTSCAHIHHGDE